MPELVVVRPLREGAAGIKMSLDEIAKRIRLDRIDPRVNAWAKQQLDRAGWPQSTTDRIQVLLDALRKKAKYVPDPIDSEFIQATRLTLCLDEQGLCFKGGDCFPQGTLLLVEPGRLVPIEMVDPGTRIWGLNGWTRVEALKSKGILHHDALTLSNLSVVRLTPDHHLFVCRPSGLERVRVGDSAPGMHLPTPRWRPPSRGCSPRLSYRNSDGTLVGGSTTLVMGAGDYAKIEIRRTDRDVLAAPSWDIQTEDHYVYLPEHDVTVSNCDDLTVALDAILMTVGIPAAIVAQSFRPDGELEHVLGAGWDGTKWLRAEPSANIPLGRSVVPTREVWVDPMSGKILCDRRPACDARRVPMLGVGKHGDFVGVGGVRMGSMNTLATAITDPTPVLEDGWGTYLEVQLLQMRKSWLEVKASREAIAKIRNIIGAPALDPDVIEGEKKPRPRWGANEEAQLALLAQIVDHATMFARGALAKKRRTAWSPQLMDLVIEGLPSDVNRIEVHTKNVGGVDRPVVSLVANADDKVVGTLGNPVAIVSIVAVASVAVAVLAYATTKKICDAFGSHLNEVEDRQLAEREFDLISNKKMTVEEAIKLRKARAESYAAAARAAAEFQKESGLGKLASAFTTFLWVALGLGAIGLGLYAIREFGPVLRRKATA